MPSLRQGNGAGKAMCDGNFSPGITTDTSTVVLTGTCHVTILIINLKEVMTLGLKFLILVFGTKKLYAFLYLNKKHMKMTQF